MLDKQTTAETTDEQVLRRLIQQIGAEEACASLTDDAIFVSGAYPRPVIGRAQIPIAEPSPELRVDERRNEAKTEQLRRLVIAASGDLAYDFGDFALSFEQAGGVQVSFGGSYLRVWRKLDGAWQVDAWFMRPNED